MANKSQTDDQKFDIKTTEKPRCSPNLLVAAIDFGTAYSGYAYSSRVDFDNDPLKITAHKWSQSLISRKTPTCALFNKKKELVAFGYDAEKQFTELTGDNKHQDYYYFERFKMKLYSESEDRRKRRLTNMSKIKDIKGEEMPAIDVFSAAIKYMKNCLIEELKEKNENVEEVENIRWVLTVPAIWDDGAKLFMRRAAEKADIRGECLTIAFEPEAASMYCKRIPLLWLTGKTKEFDVFSPGNEYLILDAGGGTVDIAIHKVLDGGRVKELHKASGGAWGGTYVDDKFFEILEEIIGKNELEKFKIECLSDYIELRQNIEIKKRDITTDSKVSFTVPAQLKQRCKSSKNCSFEELISKSKFADKLKCKGDKLQFDESLIKEWFSAVFDSIVEHVKDLLQKYNIEIILMVGGFSESPFLHETMTKTFSNTHIIVPNEAGLAVLKGAVLYGHDPQIIVSRVAKVTYGVNTLSKIQDERDVPHKNRIRDIKGVKYEKDVFSKHVTKGDELVLDVAQEEKTYSPIYPDQKSVQFSVYTSPNENPKYIDEEGCKKLGSFDVKIPDTTDGTDRKVVVKFIFGGTEIKVQGVDEKTGKITELKFDFSENAEEECFGMAVEMEES